MNQATRTFLITPPGIAKSRSGSPTLLLGAMVRAPNPDQYITPQPCHYQRLRHSQTVRPRRHSCNTVSLLMRNLVMPLWSSMQHSKPHHRQSLVAVIASRCTAWMDKVTHMRPASGAYRLPCPCQRAQFAERASVRLPRMVSSFSRVHCLKKPPLYVRPCRVVSSCNRFRSVSDSWSVDYQRIRDQSGGSW